MKQACLQGKQSEGRDTEKQRNREETDRQPEEGREEKINGEFLWVWRQPVI